jgi:hypothetical protein
MRSAGSFDLKMMPAIPFTRCMSSLSQSSSVNPTLIVTCQWATLLFSIWPRVSVTWNQRMLRTVFDARAIALWTASSTLVLEEPINSMYL